MIFNKLPMSIEVDGKCYPIKTDFRDWISFEKVMKKQVDFEEKIPLIIVQVAYLLDGNIPEDISQTITELLNFYSGGEKPNKTITSSTSQGNVFDYDYDSGYLYSAFLSQYNIDLQEIEYLHWHKFRALFKALTECKLTEIIGYRAMKIDSKMTRSQKDFYNEMKRVYAIPTDENLLEIVKRQREEYNKANH